MLRTPMQNLPDPPPITEGPYEPPASNPWFRWGMLVVCAYLLVRVVMNASERASSLPTLEAYSLLAGPLILLFNLLAFSFQWKRPWLSKAWKILAWSWLVIAVLWLEWSARQPQERASHEKRVSVVSVAQKNHC